MTTAPPRRALLDTSILIDPPTAPQLSQHADELAVSVITIAELQYGITASADPLEQIRRRQRIHAVLDQFDVLPFDIPTADYYGALATLVRQHGRNPRPRRMDLQIAATAARHDLALLTRNGDDFTGLETAITVIDLSHP
jgi:toxin FitB